LPYRRAFPQSSKSARSSFQAAIKSEGKALAETFEVSMRFHLGLLSNESKGIYTEVNS